MCLETLVKLPDFRLQTPTIQHGHVHLVAHSTQTAVVCPTCATTTSRRHGRYCRRVLDLPWMTMPVQLELHLQRFRCPNRLCPRQTFVEPLPTLAPPHAHRTTRLAQTQQRVALALGGEAGARTLNHLGMATSPDTLLRLIRAFEPAVAEAVTHVGIDDWAYRKRHRYGTIIVDLTTHRPIDLLPDYSATAIDTWLQAHPTIQVVSRDRADIGITAATVGAPQAQQIADRFHLLTNLRDAIVRLVEREGPALRAAAKQAGASERATVPSPTAALQPQVRRADPPVQRQQQLAEIQRLHAAGWTISAISRQLSMNRRTVRKYVDLQQVPVRGSRGDTSHALPFLPIIRQLWGHRCTSYLGLLRELQSQHGFTGSYSSLRRLMNRLVDERPGKAQRDVPPPPLASAPFRLRSMQQTAWALVCPKSTKPRTDATDSNQAYIAQICGWSSGINAAYTLAQRFVQLVRTRDAAGLDAWLADTEASGIRELIGFAGGLRTDYAAVANALTQPYSNGPVEAHIHRLKLIKRSMYGRANFDLLRKRVLASI